MLEDDLVEIRNHLIELEAKRGELTKAEIKESTELVIQSIAEHYKIEDIQDPEAMVKEHVVDPILEARDTRKQRKRLLEEIVIPAIDELNNTQIK